MALANSTNTNDMSQYVKSILFRRDRALFVGLIGLVTISMVFVSIAPWASAATMTVAVGSNNPAAKVIHEDFEDEVLLQFSITSSGTGESLDQIGITPTYAGTGGASDYSLRFFSDADGNGYVSDGDTSLLGSTALSVGSGVQQMFDITDMALTQSTAHNIIVLGKTVTADPADGDTLRLSVLSGGIVTVSGDDTQSGTASGNTHTME